MTDDSAKAINICPGCGGPSGGHDREMPPNPYYCDRCTSAKAGGRREPRRFVFDRTHGMVDSTVWDATLPAVLYLRDEDYDALARENEALQARVDELMSQTVDATTWLETRTRAERAEARLAKVEAWTSRPCLTGHCGHKSGDGCMVFLRDLAATIRARGSDDGER